MSHTHNQPLIHLQKNKNIHEYILTIMIMDVITVSKESHACNQVNVPQTQL